MDRSAIIVSNNEIALVRINVLRAKQEGPELEQIASFAFKTNSVEYLINHKYEARGQTYLLVVMLHDFGSIT